MKKTSTYISFVLIGCAIGFLIGTKSGLSGWSLIGEVFWGAALFYSLTLALFDWGNEYGMLVGALIGLVVAMSLDWVAGSPVDFRDKLSFMFISSFVGWGYRWGRPYWIPVIVGGLIGGVIGFALGLSRSHWFGQVCLVPGLLNAELTFVRFFMLGMATISLFLKSFGWRFIADRLQA